jgi:L-threonylcarbamoyladenylate synthase
VVAIPTDTVYGLAAALDQPKAVRQLYALKGRSHAKAIPILLSEASRAGSIALECSSAELMLIDRYWPGPLTLVLPARQGLPREVVSENEEGAPTVAVRVPDHALAQAIIAAAGGALAVTSANRTGAPPALDPDAALHSLPDVLGFIVDGGPARAGVPSTIVRVTASGARLLRDGAVPIAEIEAVLRAVRSPRVQARHGS